MVIQASSSVFLMASMDGDTTRRSAVIRTVLERDRETWLRLWGALRSRTRPLQLLAKYTSYLSLLPIDPRTISSCRVFTRICTFYDSVRDRLIMWIKKTVLKVKFLDQQVAST